MSNINHLFDINAVYNWLWTVSYTVLLTKSIADYEQLYRTINEVYNWLWTVIPYY